MIISFKKKEVLPIQWEMIHFQSGEGHCESCDYVNIQDDFFYSFFDHKEEQQTMFCLSCYNQKFLTCENCDNDFYPEDIANKECLICTKWLNNQTFNLITFKK